MVHALRAQELDDLLNLEMIGQKVVMVLAPGTAQEFQCASIVCVSNVCYVPQSIRWQGGEPDAGNNPFCLSRRRSQLRRASGRAVSAPSEPSTGLGIETQRQPSLPSR